MGQTRSLLKLLSVANFALLVVLALVIAHPCGAAPVVATSSAAARARADALLDRAETAYLGQRWAQSRQLAWSALQACPGYPRALLALGDSLGRLGDKAGAADALWRVRECGGKPSQVNAAAQRLRYFGLPSVRPAAKVAPKPRTAAVQTAGAVVAPTPEVPSFTLYFGQKILARVPAPEAVPDPDLLPIAEVMTALGWQSDSDPDTGEAVWRRENVTLRHQLGSVVVMRLTTSVPPQVPESIALPTPTASLQLAQGESVLYAPREFLTRAVGVDVELDAAAREAHVSPAKVNVTNGAMQAPSWVRAPLALSPQSNSVLSGHASGGLAVWDLGGTVPETRLAVPGRPLCVAWSPDGLILAVGVAVKVSTAEEVGQLAVWRRADLDHVFYGAPTTWWRSPDKGLFQSLAWSPDGRFLAGSQASDIPGGVHLWNPKTGQVLRSTPVMQSASRALAWLDPARNGPGRLLIADGYYRIRLWDISDGGVFARPRDFLSPHLNDVVALAYAPAPHVVAATDAQGTFSIFRAEGADTGKELYSWTDAASRHGVSAIALSADGKALASGAPDGPIGIWDTETGTARLAPAVAPEPLGVTGVLNVGNRFLVAYKDHAPRWVRP